MVATLSFSTTIKIGPILTPAPWFTWPRRASRLMLAPQSLRSKQSGALVIVEWFRIADITALGVDRLVSGLIHHLEGRRLPVHKNQ